MTPLPLASLVGPIPPVGGISPRSATPSEGSPRRGDGPHRLQAMGGGLVTGGGRP